MPDQISIAKLNKSNYPSWKFKMELLLMKKALWGIVSTEPTRRPTNDWKIQDGKAREYIGLNIEDNQLIHIKRKNTAREMWLTLESSSYLSHYPT